MSLRIWLPLNGSLKNQGLDKVTVTNNGATVDNNGKIGKCYSFGTGNSYITVDSTPLKNFTEFSFACWVKIITWNTSYATIFAIKNSTAIAWNNLIFSLLRNGSNSTLCFNIANGSSYTSTSCQTGTLSTNTWYHVVCTYKANEIKLYLNGNLVSTYTTTVVPNFNSIANFWIGKSNTNSYQSNTLLNDVRIYDHALSPQEVKKISQGLILHYPLNRNGWGQENLIRNTDFGGISQKYTVTSGTEGGFRYTPTETIVANTEYIVSCRLRGNANMNLYKLCTGGNEALNWVNRSRLSTTEYRPFSIVFTYPSNKTLNQIYICTRYGTASTSTGDWFEIEPCSLKLEKGSIATPWCPNETDSLATLVGMNTNVVKDISGYQNNGELIGTFSYTIDTPKYNVSTYAQGGASTYLKGVVLPSEAKTVSLWIKTPKNVSSAIFNDKTTGLQIGLLNSLLYANSLASTTPFTTTHWTNDGWNHVVVINNNGTRSCYINGEAETQSGSNNYYIHNANEFWVWNRSYNNNYPFTGSLSDLRIYSTALSADEVKELYENNIVN